MSKEYGENEERIVWKLDEIWVPLFSSNIELAYLCCVFLVKKICWVFKKKKWKEIDWNA